MTRQRPAALAPAWLDRPAVGVIVACATLDRLKARVAAGDLEAARILAAVVDRDLSPAGRRRFRDLRLLELAGWLRAALPDLSRRGLARLLAAAGSHLEAGGRGLPRHLAAELDNQERERLVEAVREILEALPQARANGARWPAERQLRTIVAAVFAVGNSTP